MAASSLPQIEGFAASGLGFRDDFRSTVNGLVCWRVVSPVCDSNCNDIAWGIVDKAANIGGGSSRRQLKLAATTVQVWGGVGCHSRPQGKCGVTPSPFP